MHLQQTFALGGRRCKLWVAMSAQLWNSCLTICIQSVFLQGVTMKSTVMLTVASVLATSGALAETYTVKRGDTLLDIAREQLGSSSKWSDICEMNSGLIDDCDSIQVGMVLTLSPEEVAAEEPMQIAEEEVTEEMTEEEAVVAMAAETETTEMMATFEMEGQELMDALITANEAYSVTSSEMGAVLAGSSTESVSSGGRTGAVYVEVPEMFEMSASASMIEMAVDLVAEADGTIAVAYSTNDVGNSGWKTLPVAAGENTVSMTYAVPVMNNGKGDYFGIQPDPEATGQTITVTSISGEVMSAE